MKANRGGLYYWSARYGFVGRVTFFFFSFLVMGKCGLDELRSWRGKKEGKKKEKTNFFTGPLFMIRNIVRNTMG